MYVVRHVLRNGRSSLWNHLQSKYEPPLYAPIIGRRRSPAIWRKVYSGIVLGLGRGENDALEKSELADAAPDLLAVTGAMNSGPVLVAFIIMAATAMIGYIVFGAAILRAGILPRAAALLFLLGGILFNLPPGPFPMIVLTIGGIVWAVGSVWLALKLLKV